MKMRDVDGLLALLYINEGVLPEMQKHTSVARLDAGVDELQHYEALRSFLESVGLSSRARTYFRRRLEWGLRQNPPLLRIGIKKVRRVKFDVYKLTKACRERARDTLTTYPENFYAAAIEVCQKLYFQSRGSKE